MAFQQGLSGLFNSSKAIDVVSNNIANASTVGFKGSQAHFADVYAASLNGLGASPIGAGVSLPSVAQMFSQGNITTTNNPLDIAINGGGFFRMAEPSGAVSYTRNGQFLVNKSGYMVNDQGLQLTGYATDPATNRIVPSAPAPVFIDPSDLSPVATGRGNGVAGFTGLRANLNLDSRSIEPTLPWDVPAVPAAGSTPGSGVQSVSPLTYNYSTALSIYDSLGNPHTMTLYFVKQSTVDPLAVPVAPDNFDPGSTWDMHAIVDGTNEQDVSFGGLANAGSPLKVTFDTSGKLVYPPAGDPAWEVQVDLDSVVLSRQTADPAAGIPDNSALQYIGEDPAALASTLNGGFQMDFSGTSSFGSISGVNRLDQDGYASGRLAGVGVAPDGVVTGRYTNGQTRGLAQVVLANFTNVNGLQPVGNNQWIETSVSGPPTVGGPGSASLGVLQSSAVEDSNVDLTQELVAMIVQQRSYQANAQSIKTQDSILNTLVNLR